MCVQVFMHMYAYICHVWLHVIYMHAFVYVYKYECLCVSVCVRLCATLYHGLCTDKYDHVLQYTKVLHTHQRTLHGAKH